MVKGTVGKDRCKECISYQDSDSTCYCNAQEELHLGCKSKLKQIAHVQNTRDEYEDTWYCNKCGTCVVSNFSDSRSPWAAGYYVK